jgi:transitional endoplasmic reticulum ATPase
MTKSLAKMLDSIHDDFDEMEEPEFAGFGHCACETTALLRYAANFMSCVDSAQEEAASFARWLAHNRARFNLNDELFSQPEMSHRRNAPTGTVGRRRWQGLRDAVMLRLEHPAPEGVVASGLAAVSAALGFDELDAALFGIIFRYGHDNALERLFDLISSARKRPNSLRRFTDNFAILTSMPQQEVAKRFRPGALMCASGAIRIDEDGDIHMSGRVRNLIFSCGETGEDMRSQLLGNPVAAKLPWEAFRHLGRESELARDMLGRALGQQERGVHILLYGPPGTGKTEFSAALAAELGINLHVVGEADGNGGEPSRGERLSDLLLGQRVNGGEQVLYLFDEAEDLFRAGYRDREPDPKIFIHRLLETAKVPMIWAANDIEAFTPAVLRRMSLCVEVKLPETPRRAELWQELAANEGVSLDAATAGELARLIPSAPSVARTALRAARLTDGSAETARLVARGMAKAIGHGRMPTPEATPNEDLYDPSLSRADVDLSSLVVRLARPGAPRAVSMLLSGPPGTGKSAFARHLANAMGLGVLHKRGSDIFGSYVGETERNIATAFAEARESQKFLIFDEVDSLLAGRERAVRNWEVSQVNEMLTWMESHPQPFACTTNLPEGLDAASLRRFLIRVNFDHLASAQSLRLFRNAFGMEPPERLTRLDRLVPADFTRLARRLTVLGERPSEHRLVTLLEVEMEAREGKPRGIGFARHG